MKANVGAVMVFKSQGQMLATAFYDMKMVKSVNSASSSDVYVCVCDVQKISKEQKQIF